MAFPMKAGLVTMPARPPANGKRAGAVPVRALHVSETRTWLQAVATGMPPKLTKYRGVRYMPGQRFPIDPLDVPDLEAAGLIQILEDLPTPEWWKAEGRVLQCEPGEGSVFATAASSGSLRICQGAGYDPGNAAYRFHSALNEHTKHASAFVRYLTRNNNPFHCPTQYDAVKEAGMVRALLLDADVVHCHVDWILPRNAGLGTKPKAGQLLIRHYHGTQFDIHGRQMPDHSQVVRINAEADDAVGATLVGARLTLCALRPERMSWLPITVPAARYAAMAADLPSRRWPRRPFRISHSPTKSIIKGTRELTQVVKRLKAKGLPIELVMITGKWHQHALALKATCDACYDADKLGIQGSGLEAAAMGQPVIAGDAAVAELYRKEFGEVPYTYAPTWQRLEETLARLVMDQEFYEAERRRVHQYVVTTHDYPAVAARYEQILSKALGRTDVLTNPPPRKAKRGAA